MGKKFFNLPKFVGELLISGAMISLLLIFFPFFILLNIEKTLSNGIGNLDLSILFLLIGIILVLKDKIWEKIQLITKSKKLTTIDIISFSCVLVLFLTVFNPNFLRNLIILRIIFCFLFLIFVFFVAFRLHIFFNKGIKENKPNTSKIFMLNDNPLNNFETESFHRINFLSTIVTTLNSPSLSNSMVYAISGKWGFGKTTIMNGVKNEITKMGFMTMDFSPWILYGNKSSISTEDIIRNFLHELVRVVNKDNEIPNFKKLIKKIYKLLIPSLIKLPISLDFLELETEESIEKIQKEIGSSLKEYGKPLVVFIDDLDRMDGIEIINILKIIKMCFDIKGIQFILCYDREYIDCQVEKEFGNSGSQYLDKFVQMEFVIPKIDPYDYDIVFRNYLQLLTKSIEIDIAIEDRFFTRYEKIKYSIFNCLDTPRAIKLFLNRYIVAVNLLKGEVDYFDLLLIQLLLFKYPDIYSQIFQNSDDFIDIGGIIAKDRTYLNHFCESILSKDSSLLSIIQMLFPKVDHFVTKEPFSINNNYFGYYSNNNGLHNSEYFLKYFIFSVQNGDISDSIWKAFLLQLGKKCDLSNNSNNYIKEFEAYASRSKWINKLTKSIKNYEIEENECLELWNYLCNHDQDFMEGCDNDVSMFNEVVGLYTSLFKLLFKKNSKSNRRLVAKFHNIYILFGIFQSLSTNFDKEEIIALLSKIRTEIIRNINKTFPIIQTRNPQLNIFWILRIIYQNDESLKYYSSLIIDRNSKKALISLIDYLSPENDVNVFLVNELPKYYDPNRFLILLKKNKINKPIVVDQINLFLQNTSNK